MITFLLLGKEAKEEDPASCAANMDRWKAAYARILKLAEGELNGRDWLTRN